MTGQARAISSFGRALPWHGRGDRFKSGMVHQKRSLKNRRPFLVAKLEL